MSGSATASEVPNGSLITLFALETKMEGDWDERGEPGIGGLHVLGKR
jgi:hypothetical protein